MPKKNRKRTSSIPFSAPEAPPKKARKAVSKQQQKTQVSYNKIKKINASKAEEDVPQEINVDVIINEDSQSISSKQGNRTSKVMKGLKEAAVNLSAKVLGNRKKVDAPKDEGLEPKVNSTSKNGSKPPAKEKLVVAGKKTPQPLINFSKNLSNALKQMKKGDISRLEEQWRSSASASIDNQSDNEDIQMIDQNNVQFNIDAAAEEDKVQSADTDPNIYKNKRLRASKLAEEAKENEKLVKDALYASGDDGNNSSESDNEQDIDAQVENDQDQDDNVIKKKSTVVLQEHKKLLKVISNNFSIPYGEAGVRDQPAFSQYLQDQKYMDSIKSFCNFRYFKYLKGDTVRIPKTLAPNDLLVDLFKGNDLRLIQHLAFVLEKYAGDKILAYISTEYVKEAVSQIPDIYNVNEVALFLHNVFPKQRLKAVAEALDVAFEQQSNQRQIIPQTWFHTCIVPALKASHIIDLNSFSTKNIMMIKKVCDASRLTDLGKGEAVIYSMLLKKAGVHCLDSFYNKIGIDDDDFWTEVLTTVYEFSLGLTQLTLQNKDTMITTAVYNYNKQYNPPVDFFVKVARFQRMTYEELVELGELSVDFMLDIFLDLMPSHLPQDFSAFSLASRILKNYKAPVQISAMKTSLKDRPLKEWSSYEKLIQCTLNYTQGDASLAIVKKALEDVSKADMISIATDDVFKVMKNNWNQAFASIQQKKRILQMDWQQHLVLELNFQLANDRSVMVSLGTGHGKSVIIQLLADMQAMNGVSVIIVCLNRFLAYWGQSTYGSPYVANFKIRYMDLNSFLQTTPDKNTIVICDEIDQMGGAESFKLMETSHTFEAFYFPSFIQEWGQVVGFSGTMSDATVQQIRCSFPNAFNLTIPSLRKYGSENKLTKVMVVTPQNPFTSLVKQRINELKNSCKNFIILTKDVDDLKEMVSSLKDSELLKDKILVEIPSYDSDFQSIAAQIRSLKTSDFIVVTTQVGGIAVDFQGVSNAHTMEAYTPETSSQLIQGIGRGSRDLQSSAEGTIITKNPLTIDASAYIEDLEILESEKNHSLQLNSKVARTLHHFTFDKLDEMMVQQIKWFVRHFKKSDDFRYDGIGLTNWQSLRKIIKDPNMPVKPFDNWEQK